MSIVFIVSVFVVSLKNVVKLGVILINNEMELLTNVSHEIPTCGEKKSLCITNRYYNRHCITDAKL